LLMGKSVLPLLMMGGMSMKFGTPLISYLSFIT